VYSKHPSLGRACKIVNPAKERDVLASVSVKALGRNRSWSVGRRFPAAGTMDALDPEQRAARREQIIAEVTIMIREALEEMPLLGEAALDLDGIEMAVQAALRPVGGRLVEGAIQERVLACEATPPRCPKCQGRMEREQRERRQQGLVGFYALQRGYYRCRRCRATRIAADE
jgi:hypothetical protein